MKAVTLHLPNELSDQLTHLAIETGQTTDFHLQQALNSYLATFQPTIKKREIPTLNEKDKEVFGKIYQTSAEITEDKVSQKLLERNHKFSFIDLFAGVGGFHFALKELGGECVFASEWDSNAQKTYYENHHIMPFGDITLPEVKAQIPQNFDVLCAGFPCQAFSIAGYQKGFSDSRGTLFFEIEQIISKHRPKVVFLENVKNLVSHDKGNTFKVILDTLENKLDYTVFYKVLNTAEYANIPQNRERIFIVAFNNDYKFDLDKFEFPNKIELTKTIHSILDKNKQDESFYYHNSKYIEKLKSEMKSKDTLYQWRRVYVRENKNGLCPTLTANMGTGGHNVPLLVDDYGIRKLTPKECFAFQGYDISKFILPDIANSKLYMQAGNSVTMPLVKRVAQQFIKVIANEHQ